MNIDLRGQKFEINPTTKLIWINIINGADKVETYYSNKIKEIFPNDKLIGVICGVAYGGSVEAIAKSWIGIGKVYGYDTYEKHPKHLSDNPLSEEAICMDQFYEQCAFGSNNLSIEYIDNTLKNLGLNNFSLIKGEVNKNSFDILDKVHYVMLDMDLEKPMRLSYDILKNKIVKNGYLLLHDTVGHYDNTFPLLEKLYNDIKGEGLFEVIEDIPSSYLSVLKKISD